MKLRLTELSVRNQRVLMRVDFNVPLKEDGSILDDSRIRAALPSIRYCVDHGCKLILMSHLGRPKGTKDPKASLAPCAQRLSELLGHPVVMASDCVGPAVEKQSKELHPGSILLLENVRFHVGEEEPDREPRFVEQLARLGDLYVNDAFGTAHRAHASTALIAQYFPHKSAMGFLIERELQFLEPLLHNPKRPFYAIIGGGKVSSKAGVVKNMLNKLDALFIGGAMAFPFLASQHISIGQSMCSESDIPLAKEILQLARDLSVQLYLPVDFVATKANAPITTFSSHIPEGWSGMDIGPQTVQQWKKAFQPAATIYWNGPVGVYEKPPFDKGTQGIAQALAQCKAITIIGGGDSTAAVQQMGLGNSFTHLSTGGGASLEFLEYGHLPGIDALSDA